MSSFDKIKLIALDLDGTVLTSDKRVTARTENAIRQIIDKGIETVYVTGRPLSGIPHELMTIPGIRYVVTSNGAVTYDLQKGSRLRMQFLEKETALRIMQMPEISGLLYSVFVDGMGYCDWRIYEALKEKHKNTIYREYVDNSRKGVDDILEFISMSPEGVENIWITTPDKELRDYINVKINSNRQVRTVLTGRTDVEAGHLNCDKGLALKGLADHLDIKMENVIAAGDNDNDRGMLKEAGISVAMGNALESIRKSAAIITDTNDNDGVAKVLEECFGFCFVH